MLAYTASHCHGRGAAYMFSPLSSAPPCPVTAHHLSLQFFLENEYPAVSSCWVDSVCYKLSIIECKIAQENTLFGQVHV